MLPPHLHLLTSVACREQTENLESIARQIDMELAAIFNGVPMQFIRTPLAIALTAASLCVGSGAMAQTVAPQVTPAPLTTPTGTGAGTTAPAGTAPAPERVPKGFAADLARASLAKQGITNPTRAQLDAERSAIEKQRAQGQGWGVIAQSLGLNFGKVVSEANKARHDAHKSNAKGHDEEGHKGKHDKSKDKDSGRRTGAEQSGGDRDSGKGGGNGGGKGGGEGGGKGGK